MKDTQSVFLYQDVTMSYVQWSAKRPFINIFINNKLLLLLPLLSSSSSPLLLFVLSLFEDRRLFKEDEETVFHTTDPFYVFPLKVVFKVWIRTDKFPKLNQHGVPATWNVSFLTKSHLLSYIRLLVCCYWEEIL